jgi:pimeloyl-ACP methyl ester carboxylesterase
MPQAKINGVKLYYEVHGQGEPLLMIQGLGHHADFWFLQVPELSKHFQLIIFDNRGTGRSDKPDEPYSIAGMAADALGLLQELGLDQAHILGASMGGYIAQEIAVEHPERVKRLVLLCTHYGGPEYLQLTKGLWQEITDVAGLSPEEIYRKGIKYSTTPAFFAEQGEMVEKLVRMRLEHPQPAHAFQRQFAAAAGFQAQDRISRIKAPTLVVAGREDRVVPLQLVEKLAGAIPHAKLQVIDDAAHLLFVEQSGKVNRAIVDFLKG